MRFEKTRQLTDDEIKLIRDYVISNCGKGRERDGEALLKDILTDDELKMHFLYFAQKNEPFSLGGMRQYVYID